MVSVKQVAEAIAGALEQGKGGRCYQVGDENHTWIEILQMFGEIVGRENNEVTVLPDSVFREASRVDGFYMAMLGKEPGMDAVELVELMTAETYFDPGLPETSAVDAITPDGIAASSSRGWVSLNRS